MSSSLQWRWWDCCSENSVNECKEIPHKQLAVLKILLNDKKRFHEETKEFRDKWTGPIVILFFYYLCNCCLYFQNPEYPSDWQHVLPRVEEHRNMCGCIEFEVNIVIFTQTSNKIRNVDARDKRCTTGSKETTTISHINWNRATKTWRNWKRLERKEWILLVCEHFENVFS